MVLVARVLVLVGLSSVAPLEKGDVKVVAAMFHATPKKSKRARGGGGGGDVGCRGALCR